jgi:hypothetical protein
MEGTCNMLDRNTKVWVSFIRKDFLGHLGTKYSDEPSGSIKGEFFDHL